MKWCIDRSYFAAGISLFCLAATSPAIAQITPDRTLPTTVTRSGNLWEITGGAQSGRNLFQSFSEFSVPTGNTAYFNNALSIENIFSRVTGTSASNIDGLIRANGTANLFLLNPNGILFGPNARLDIGGSFTATTANRIVFADGTEFTTKDTQSTPLLTVSVPLGLQHGIKPSGTITNTGNLAVKPQENITLFGTTVTTTGQLIAPGGTVRIMGDRIGLFNNALIDVSAVGGGGTVLIGGDYQGKGTVPNATRTLVGRNATINADAVGNGDGGRVIVWSDDNTQFYGNISARGGANSGKGGFVEVSGGQFLDYQGFVDTRAPFGVTGTLLLDPTNIEVVASGGETNNLADVDAFTDADIGTPGDTRINAGAFTFALANVTLQATQNITFNAPVNILFPGVGLTAQAGNNITVNSPITTLGGAVQLIANDANSGVPSGTGSIFINASIQSLGGAIALRAGGDISINNASVLTAGLFSNSGDLSIETGRLLVQNFGTLSTGTFGIGNAGNIAIRASEIDLIAPASPIARLTGISALANPGSTGNAGIITINTGRLTARNGAQVSAGTSGSGSAGVINVRASQIELIGVLSANGFPSGLLADSNAGSTGNAGTIDIQTGSLITRDGGGVFVSTESAGNGGALNITASSIELSGNGIAYPSGLIAQAFPSATGNAGQITIGTGRLLVQNRAQVTTSAASGRAGNLNIQATDSIDVLNRGVLNAVSTGAGAGGDMAIATRNLTLQDGFIFSNATNQGNGGNIAINSLESVRIAGTSFISTGALGSGAGGNLSIETGTLTISDESSILTSGFSQRNSGNLRVRATNAVNVTGAGILSTGNLGTGTGGTMEIETGQMLVSDQAEVSSFSIGGNAGNVTIRTGQLQVRDKAEISTATETGNAGNLNVQATASVNLDGGSLLTYSTMMGSGGTIAIDTRNLTLQNGGKIDTGTINRGSAGNIAINSSESVTVTGNRSIISAASFGSATGGNLSINTGTLTLNGGSIITSTAGQGNAGNLVVKAANSVNVTDGGILSTGTLGTGAGGNLSIETRNLNILTSGKVFTSSLDARTFDYSNLDPNIYSPAALEIIRNSVNTAAQGNFTQGNSGNLSVIATDSVNVATNGLLSTQAYGQASAGNLAVSTGRLTLQNAGTISATSFGDGFGGNVQLQANSLSLTSDGRISSRSQGANRAGNISINVRDDLQSNRGDILATAVQSGGGDITITAKDIRLRNSSLISSSVFDSTGGGGNISINSETFIALEDSDILANAISGSGGNIRIISPAFLADLFDNNRATAVGRNPGDLSRFRGNSRVDISDNFARSPNNRADAISNNNISGDSGAIIISSIFSTVFDNDRADISAASQSGPSGKVETSPLFSSPRAPLSANLDASRLIVQSCRPAGNTAGEESRFVVTGRGGLPPSPNDVLRGEADAIEVHPWVTLDSQQQEQSQDTTSRNAEKRSSPITRITSAKPELVEAQGWMYGANGEVILTASAPTVTPQSPSLRPVDCPNFSSEVLH